MGTLLLRTYRRIGFSAFVEIVRVCGKQIAQLRSGDFTASGGFDPLHNTRIARFLD